MRTKTLLLTAALGVAAAATTMAQVYSVNAVGYVNVTLVKGWNMIANPLQNQTDNSVPGLFGDMPLGTTVYKWNGTGFDSATSLGGGDWIYGGPEFTVVPGDGIFVFVPADAETAPTVTFVGEVPQGDASNMNVKAGFQLIASKVPQAGKVTTDLKFPGDIGDTVYKWNGSGYDSYTCLGGTDWLPEEPSVAVAQSFWSYKAAAVNWTRNFSVNP